MIELQTVWGWQPALYLFFGGLGAGTFLISALVHIATKKHGKLVAAGMWSAVACLVIGLVLLITEVTGPFKAILMWRSFSNLPSSWMAIGCWLLFAGLVFFFVSACAMTPLFRKILRIQDGTANKVATACAAIGMLLAIGIAAYTGILLEAAPGVPFWSTNYLPLLFTISAIDTGVALTMLIALATEPEPHGMVIKLEVASFVLILAEIAALILFITYMLGGGNQFMDTLEVGYSATATASAQSWLTGQLAVPFWALLVAIGLAVPLALDMYAMFGKNPRGRKAPTIVGALCVLVGGCTLRFITVLAGTHVDVISNTVAALL